jgi:hypothetical protein
MTQPAGLAQGLDQFAAFGIHIGAMRMRNALPGPGIQRLRQTCVMGSKKGHFR